MSVARREDPPPAADFVTACATDVDLYLHPLLEEPPVRSSVSRQVWTEYQGLVSTARAACSACPLLDSCLCKAVVHVDVSGHVGCTSPRERTAIRRLIGVTVAATELDQFAGARGDRQPVEHEDALRMRAQHPDDSLEILANRLDCSLSTVKRHLRRARNHDSAGAATGSGPPVDRRWTRSSTRSSRSSKELPRSEGRRPVGAQA
jgi:Transcription factor WhiB